MTANSCLAKGGLISFPETLVQGSHFLLGGLLCLKSHALSSDNRCQQSEPKSIIYRSAFEMPYASGKSGDLCK